MEKQCLLFMQGTFHPAFSTSPFQCCSTLPSLLITESSPIVNHCWGAGLEGHQPVGEGGKVSFLKNNCAGVTLEPTNNLHAFNFQEHSFIYQSFSAGKQELDCKFFAQYLCPCSFNLLAYIYFQEYQPPKVNLCFKAKKGLRKTLFPKAQDYFP